MRRKKSLPSRWHYHGLNAALFCIPFPLYCGRLSDLRMHFSVLHLMTLRSSSRVDITCLSNSLPVALAQMLALEGLVSSLNNHFGAFQMQIAKIDGALERNRGLNYQFNQTSDESHKVIRFCLLENPCLFSPFVQKVLLFDYQFVRSGLSAGNKAK
jgi:hypothetical protein